MAQGSTTQKVTATDLDVRDLTSVSDSVSAVQSGAWNVTNISGTVSLPTGASTSAKQDTIIGHVDGIEGLLTTIDADTSNLSTKIDTIAGAVSGTEMQVDLVGALPAGTNAIGKLSANSGVDIGDVDVTSVIPGTGATNLGKAIDTATGATDTGVLLLGTRDDALSTLTPAEGDNTQLRTDSTGALWVKSSGTVTVDGSGVTQPVSNAGLTELAAAINSNKVDVNIVSSDVATGGTSSIDDADFTATTTTGTPAMGVYESSPTNVTDGDLGIVGITQGRRLKTSTTIDTALPAGTNAIGKLSANSGVDIGDVDVTSISAGDNTIGRLKITDGTDVADVLDLANSNPIAVAIVDASGDQIASFGGGTQYTEDAASAGNPVGTVPILIRADTPAGVASTDGDNVGQRGTNYGAAYVQLVTSSGAYIDSVGGGTEYTEDVATANPIVGKAIMVERDDALSAVTPIEGDNIGLRGTAEGALWTQDFNSDAILADTTAIKTAVEILDNAISGSEMQVDIVSAPTLTVDLGVNNDVTVTGSVTANAGTNLNTSALALESGGNLAAILADTTNIETAVQLIDDTVATLGTTTYSEATTKGMTIGAVRRDADTTLVDTTNEIGPLQMDANGRLKVEAFSGETLPVSLTSTTVTGTVAVTQSGTWDEVGINDSGNSITVDNAGTFAVQVDGNALTALQLIDDVVYTDDADWTDSTSKHALVGGLYQSTPQTVTDGDVAPFNMTANGALHVSDAGGSLTVDGTVTANLSATDNTVLDNIDADTSAIQTAVELIDDTVYVDDADWTADTSKHTLVGAVTQVATTANTDGDVTPLTTNGMRELRVAIPESDLATAGTAHVKKYYTNAGAVTDGIVWSPAAGKRWFVTDLIINVSAASTVTFEDDKAGGDEVVMKFELAANSGLSHTFTTPLFSGEDAADLLVTTTAGNVYITAVGYEV